MENNEQEKNAIKVIDTQRFYDGLKNQNDIDSITKYFNSAGVQIGKEDLQIIAKMVSVCQNTNGVKVELNKDEMEYIAAGKISPAAAGLIRAGIKGGLIGAGLLGGGAAAYGAYRGASVASVGCDDLPYIVYNAGRSAIATSVGPLALGAVSGAVIGVLTHLVKTLK